MASPFEIVMAEALKQGQSSLAKSSIKWYRQNVKGLAGSPSSRSIMTEEGAKLINSPRSLVPGRLYFFHYDPKHKKSLPYYDTFPLILYLGPSAKRPNHFLGINFHYLNYSGRAHLLSGFYDVLNNTRMNESTKIEATYGLMKTAAKFRGFKPAIKEYIPNHVRSRFMKVPAADWTTSVFLPVEAFEKVSKRKVWAESQKMTGRLRNR